MKYILTVVVSLLLFSSLGAQELDQLYNNVASLETRFKNSDGKWTSTGRYSGSFIAENDTSFLILTCGHGPFTAPFGSTTWVKCYYDKSRPSVWMPGYVDWYKYVKDDRANDIGFVVIRKAEFIKARYPLPKVHDLSSLRVDIGHSLVTLGHPAESHYPTAMLTYVSRSYEDTFEAHPAIKPGRSGSAFYNKNGDIVGVALAYRAEDDRSYVVTTRRIFELITEYSVWKQNRELYRDNK